MVILPISVLVAWTCSCSQNNRVCIPNQLIRLDCITLPSLCPRVLIWQEHCSTLSRLVHSYKGSLIIWLVKRSIWPIPMVTALRSTVIGHVLLGSVIGQKCVW